MVQLVIINIKMPFQSQAPPAKSGGAGGGSGGKTEAELKEEEELQLAIALSQSEAQAKEDAKRRGHHSTPKFSSEVTHKILKSLSNRKSYFFI